MNLAPIGPRDLGRRVGMELGHPGLMAIVAPQEVDVAARIEARLGRGSARRVDAPPSAPALSSDEGSAYWPPGAPHELRVNAFVAAYGTLGYVVCEDEEHEPGFEKIALFAHPSGEPTHAARQLDATGWTSKIGWRLQDIRHPLRALEGESYGQVVRMLKRAIRPL